jgi:ribosomal protein S18 acetylase RimI-like enzyme
MQVCFTPVAEFGAARTAELMTRAFADYLVKIAFTGQALERMQEMDDLAPEASLVAWVDEEPVGTVLVARRGNESRVAGMGVVPAARQRGVGRALTERVLADARVRRDRRVLLEVIGQNAAAVALYEAVGFTRQRRLLGFAGPAPAGLAAEPGLQEVALRDVAAAIARQEGVDWPWQISAETIARLPAPATGYLLDGAWIALMNPAGPTVGIRAAVVEGGGNQEARAVRLLRAVMARHPAAEWRMSALLPEEFAAWFTGAGLAPTPIYQWQMECPLG